MPTDDRQRGAALVAVLMVISLMTVLGTALTLATITETAVAANYRDATEARYAAEGAVAFVIQEIAPVMDWRDVLEGRAPSAIVDGPPSGTRRVGGRTIDLAAATTGVNAMATVPSGSRWSPSVLYAYGPLETLVPEVRGQAAPYVSVWVADRSPETADPFAPPEALSVVGHAYGPQGSRSAVEAIVARTETSAVIVRAWRELR